MSLYLDSSWANVNTIHFTVVCKRTWFFLFTIACTPAHCTVVSACLIKPRGRLGQCGGTLRMVPKWGNPTVHKITSAKCRVSKQPVQIAITTQLWYVFKLLWLLTDVQGIRYCTLFVTHTQLIHYLYCICISMVGWNGDIMWCWVHRTGVENHSWLNNLLGNLFTRL